MKLFNQIEEDITVSNITLEKFFQSRFSDIKFKMAKLKSTRNNTNIDSVESAIGSYIKNKGKTKIKLSKFFSENNSIKIVSTIYKSWVTETLKRLKSIFQKDNKWLDLSSIIKILAFFEVGE